MNSYYLDSTSWINLAHNTTERHLVLNRVDRNSIRVLAGWVVLDELVNEGVKDWDNYTEFIKDFWKIVRERILSESNFRMTMEFLRNRPLDETEMYIPFLGIDGIIGKLDEHIIRRVANEIREDKEKSDENLSQVRDGVLEHYKNQEIDPSSNKWREFENNFREEAREYAKTFWQRTLETKKFDELLAFSSYFYCELERLRLMAKEGRSHRRLGHHDQLVFVDARSSRCDFIVTDDKGLTEIATNLHERLNSGPIPIKHNKFINFLKGDQ